MGTLGGASPASRVHRLEGALSAQVPLGVCELQEPSPGGPGLHFLPQPTSPEQRLLAAFMYPRGHLEWKISCGTNKWLIL